MVRSSSCRSANDLTFRRASFVKYVCREPGESMELFDPSRRYGPSCRFVGAMQNGIGTQTLHKTGSHAIAPDRSVRVESASSSLSLLSTGYGSQISPDRVWQCDCMARAGRTVIPVRETG